MKIIFSPTKSMTKLNNDYKSNTYIYNHILSKVISKYNVEVNNIYNQAIFYYNGISFKYLNPLSLTNEEISYLDNNLYILSALYGVLKPLDNICKYRLDFKDKSLYNEFYNLINEVFKDEDLIINLASNEYSKMLGFIDCNKIINICFKSHVNSKYVSKATYSKMARGKMLEFMAINKIEDVNDILKFNELDYKYDSLLSTKNNLVFVKEE